MTTQTTFALFEVHAQWKVQYVLRRAEKDSSYDNTYFSARCLTIPTIENVGESLVLRNLTGPKSASSRRATANAGNQRGR